MRHHAMSSEPFSIMWRAPRRRLCMRGGVWRRIATAGLVAVALCYVFYSAGRHGAATAATTTSLPRGPLLLLRTRAKGTTSAQQKQPLPPDSGGQQRAWESATLAAVASLRVSAGPQPVRWFKKGGPRVLPKRSLNRHNTDETLWPLDSDVWIASYPKSGQTWIRFLLANIINYHKRAPIDFSTVEDRIPFLEDGREEWIAWAFKSAPSPRIFKSHQPFLTPPAKYPCNRQLSQSNVQCLCPNCAERFQRVIYVIRDGRDVMYSYYQFRHGLGQNLGMNFTQFLDPKNKHYPGPLWHEHVESWLNRKKSGQVDMLVVRYEDLHRNTTGVLKQMADFVGIATSPEQIEWAVQASSADSMRQIERKKGPGFFERKYVKVQQRKGKQFNFVRGASVGKWATVYTPADIQLFMSYAGSMMRKLGYVGYAPAADIT